MPVAAIGLGLGLVGTVGKLISSGKANSSLEKLIAQNPTYTANPIASQRLGLATALLNARAPGIASAERNVQANAANQQANIERNATSGAQAIAAGSANEGSANNAYTQLQEQEDRDYARRYGNLSEAEQGVISEGDKAYQAQVRRFGDLAQIRGAQNANTQNAWQSVSNLGFSSLNFGLAGGFRNLFNKTGSAATKPGAVPTPYYPLPYQGTAGMNGEMIGDY